MADDVVLLIDDADSELVNVNDYDAPNDGDVSLVDTSENTASQQLGIAPPLPPGKLYHAFFSHSSEDNGWVRNVLERLESSEYGFKCCVADRDFDLGAPVFQNITKSILSSCKTVIVMSPEFLHSQWCSYEAQITMEHDIDLRRRLLIPVMLRECTVPEFIGRVTYMDVNNEHFWARFVAALQDVEVTSAYDVMEPHGSKTRMMAVPFSFNPNFCNGEMIDELNAYNPCECGESEFLVCQMPHGLDSRGIAVDETEYTEVKRLLSTSRYVRCHGCSDISLTWAAVGTGIFLLFISALCFSMFGATVADYDATGANIFVFIWVAACVCVFAFVGPPCCAKIKAVRGFYGRLRGANDILFKRNIMVCSYDRGICNCNCNMLKTFLTYATQIMFFYYEWRSCEHVLLEFMSRHETVSGNTDQLRDKVHSMLLDHAIEYGQLLVRHRLPKTSTQRHNRQGECLCQFIERILQERDAGCISKRLFKTESRNPWKLFNYF